MRRSLSFACVTLLALAAQSCGGSDAGSATGSEIGDPNAGGGGDGSGGEQGGDASAGAAGAAGSLIDVGEAGRCTVTVTCESAGANCGAIDDGCGGILECGECTAPETCGGGGPNVCGSATCTPRTCEEANADCGPVGDGCGGLLDCGTCDQPERCGGDSSQPSRCAIPSWCTNLCQQQVSCQNNGTTTVSGTVYAPTPAKFGKADPIYNAIVYIPNAPLEPFTPGVTCDQCGASASGRPLVTATSGPDGKFVIENVPVGTNIPLVIQIGRWRREVTIPKVEACEDTPLPAELTRLPRNKSEGDIPLMAIVTSAFDATECLMRKIGVADGEFTDPNGGGRIHIYKGAGSSLPKPAAAVNGDGLWNNAAQLAKYDIVALPCGSYPTTPAGRDNVAGFADAGGRVFITDLSQDVIMSGRADWKGTANFGGASFSNPGTIDKSFPKGAALADWLALIGATPTNGQITLNDTYGRVKSVNPPSQQWIYSKKSVQTYSFNTPVAAEPDEQCGRAIYSSFHVTAGAGGVFPSRCDTNPMTAQEKALEFMIFDLASCVTPDIPTCTPKTCEELGLQCGPSGDGCGNIIQCGECPDGETCGGGGKPGVCGDKACTPKTCAQLGAECGRVADGCADVLRCGTCPPSQSCDIHNKCVDSGVK